jgi:hypothetical protein
MLQYLFDLKWFKSLITGKQKMVFRKLLKSTQSLLILTVVATAMHSSALAFDSLRDVPKEEQRLISSCIEGKQIIKVSGDMWLLVSKKYTEEKGSPVTCTEKDAGIFKFGNLELVTKNGAFRYVYPSNSNYLWMSIK